MKEKTSNKLNIFRSGGDILLRCCNLPTSGRLRLATLLLCLLLVIPSLSQAIVVNNIANDGVTTAQITAALQGSGVTISNLIIVNNGCANRNQAVGLFSQGTTPTGSGPVLGDANGVVLGTGPLKIAANPLVSPNDVGNWTNTLCTSNVSDPDMVQLVPQTANGEYIAIEFDIVPALSIMTIPFQFGSDEFPEYVCSAYNDVTGIFVSGPGITGPYSNNSQNYAKTSNGDLSSINWVNTGVVGNQGTLAQCGSLTNTAYYTDNSNGDLNGGNAAVATTNANLELDGWTNYIYRPITVLPGQTYHVKAAIADAGDRVWDSAVFFHLISSSGSAPGFDFGDAPDSYRTLTSSGGPRHGISSNIFLGSIQPDNEVTGQPTTTANGDDITGIDDEDGIGAFPPLSTSATSYAVNVTVNNNTGSTATLIGWIDFNDNGSFEPSEGVSTNVFTGTSNGTSTLSWTGLSGLVTGTTYARFRLTTDNTITTSTPGGTASNGEVEDFTLTITEPNLSTSTKTWVDLNGGDHNPGDVLRYSITIIESNGAAATNVSVSDIISAGLIDFSVESSSIPAGATDSSTPGTGPLSVTGISVPASGSVTIVFDVAIAAVAPGTTIDNTATITNPAGPGGAPNAPTVTVAASAVPGSGNKQLYLSGAPAYSLSRTPTTGTPAYITLAKGGASQTWDLSAPLQSAITLDPALSPTVPINLYMASNRKRNITAQVSLTCSAGGATLTQTLTERLNTTPEIYTPPFELPLGTALICPAGATWQLTIQNTTTGNGTRDLRVYPVNGTDLNTAIPNGVRSQVILPSSNVINVDNLSFYNDTYANGGTQVTSVSPGGTVYIRALVSDPFGSYDISGATLDLSDSNGTPILTGVPMSEVNNSGAATKTYESAYTVPVMPPLGFWTASVSAAEGTEGTVTDTAIATFNVAASPVLTIVKSADKANVNPGEVITYTITVTNTGGSPATTVQVSDALSPYIAMILDFDGTVPPYDAFAFADGGSGLTFNESTDLTYFDANGPYIPNYAAGEDGAIISWQLNMTGGFISGSQFTLVFKVRVK